jgi:ubiquinone/menaquinone biosynthesis C-methylase UbiE
MNNPQAQAPSPVLIFETINAFQRSAAIKAAVDLEIFTAISEGNRTVGTIARRCAATERGISILCDYLTVIGFLTKEDSQYGLTVDSSFFLSRTSPAYVGDALDFMLSPTIRQAFDDLATTARTGTTILGGEGIVSPENAVWIRFAKAMGHMAFGAAQQIAALAGAKTSGPIRVLDIAAGHGMYGIAFATANPQAHIYAADWPKVVEVAQANAKAAGVGDRYHTIPGSAFETDLGDGYDIALITNFLHHFDPSRCETALRKIHKSLKPGATAWTVEFVPNPDRVTPEVPAAFSLIMLATTGSGNAYTYAELERMLLRSGFTACRRQDLEMSFQTVIVASR